jgi:signal transduction histidine kinase
VRLVVIVALSVASSVAPAQAPESEGASRRVVILNATDPYLPAFLAIDGALRAGIRAGSKVPAELYAEALDMHRFPQTLIDQDLVALLRKKYRSMKVDVVVADALIALDFAQRHREEIWPGAAIVFNSVPTASLQEHRLDSRMIGIPVRLELGPTLDLALRLRPETRRIAVVSGTADPDRNILSLAQVRLAQYAGRLEVQYIVGLPVAQTVEAVRALPADAVVLYLTVFRDGTGAPQVPREVLTRVAAASRVPVFGVFETYLGHGIAAGSITSYGAQGRSAGALVARVLNGEDPAAIGVQAPVPPGCMADWRQIHHWGIDERLLPADCEVRYKQVTAWTRYRWQILAALAVILAQSGLIVALMLSRRRLRGARQTLENENSRRTRAEALAARLQARLARFSKERSLGTMVTTIVHEINQPLIAIQNYAQAAKRRLQDDVGDKPKLIELCGKIEGQAERAGVITQRIRSLVNASDVRMLPVSPCPVLEAVVRMMEPETENSGCRIVCESVGELPAVLADSLQVQLVLVNLLQNAMRSVCASDRYGKAVSVDVRAIDDRQVQVSVTDQGAGVPADRVGDIFEPLYSGASGGMGMGLAVSRGIIEAHGGRLWYEPNPGGGAIFRFTLQAVAS